MRKKRSNLEKAYYDCVGGHIVDEFREELHKRAYLGKKYDDKKLRWDLLPYAEIEDVVKILTHGAKKYGDENWKEVKGGRWRYLAAAMRHIVTWKKGEIVDRDTGVSHLAHAVCCLLFLMWIDKKPPKKSYVYEHCGTCIFGSDGICLHCAGGNYGHATEVSDGGWCENWKQKNKGEDK